MATTQGDTPDKIKPASFKRKGTTDHVVTVPGALVAHYDNNPLWDRVSDAAVEKAAAGDTDALERSAKANAGQEKGK